MQHFQLQQNPHKMYELKKTNWESKTQLQQKKDK